MKILLAALLLLAPWAAAQTVCGDYTYNTGVPDLTPDSKGHQSGQHTYNGGATLSCIYSSSGSPYCASEASVQPYGSINDVGLLTTFPLGFHVGGVAVNPQTGVNPDGGSQAAGNAAGAVEWCVSSTCAVNVSANPISFPPGSVWTHGPSYNITCPARTDPEYSCGVSCHCCTCSVTGGCASPIIVDVLGRGFHLSSAQNGVVFDIRGDGKPELVAWPVAGSGNAFLALDRNGNGKIDSGRELFGNYTPQPKCPHPNGFLALSEYDDNHDGVIDARDAVFSKLRLWIDANHNGMSEPGELHTMPELGVYSIDLHYTESPQTDMFGNAFKLKARVNVEGEPKGDAVDRWTYDVWLVTQTDVKYGHVKKGSAEIISGEDRPEFSGTLDLP